MKKGEHHTPETIEKIKRTKKDHPLSEEAREKMRRAQLGHHPSPETIKKMKESNKRPSLITRAKMRAAQLGRTRSVEAVRKSADARRGKKRSPDICKNISRAKKGRPNGRLGMHHSKATIEKMSGSNHYNWNGGSSFEPYPISWTSELKESIRRRDKYVCQLCDVTQAELGKKLDVHHINYNKKDLDPKNLISLCRRCHLKTNRNREGWKTEFHTHNGGKP